MRHQDSFLDRTLHAIADSTRRRILEELKKSGSAQTSNAAPRNSKKCSGLCAGDIEERVRLSQPTISHHMAILTKANLVEVVKEGQWRWYRRNEKAIGKMIRGLRARI